VPDAVLAAQFLALEGLAPGRVIAGLGTGDRLSEVENRAYGIRFGPAAERRTEMVGDGGKAHLCATHRKGRENMDDPRCRCLSGCQFHLDFPQAFRRHDQR